jgi:hypothetical protein
VPIDDCIHPAIAAKFVPVPAWISPLPGWTFDGMIFAGSRWFSLVLAGSRRFAPPRRATSTHGISIARSAVNMRTTFEFGPIELYSRMEVLP